MKDLQDRITRIANETWQRIGFDILSAAMSSSIPREEVVDAVADYLEAFTPEDETTITEFRTLPIEKQTEMLTAAFPFNRYSV